MGRGRGEIDGDGQELRYDLLDASPGAAGGDVVRLSTAAGIKTPVEVCASAR